MKVKSTPSVLAEAYLITNLLYVLFAPVWIIFFKPDYFAGQM